MKKAKIKKYSVDPVDFLLDALVDALSQSVAGAIDERISLRLEGYVCQIVTKRETFNIKFKPNKLERFILRLINWRVVDI